MPELPEVETVRRRLEPKLVGRRLERVEISDTRLTRPFDPVEVAAELRGERVAAVDRRGKYLIVRFESGRAAKGDRTPGRQLRSSELAQSPAECHMLDIG